VKSAAHPAVTANALPQSRGRGGTFRPAIPAIATPMLAHPHFSTGSNPADLPEKRAEPCDSRLSSGISF